MRIILIILPIIFFSCKTVKEVVKVETRYDSTAIIQNEGLQRTLQETIENYEKEREQWENTGVTFFRDNVVTGTDTTGKNNWTTGKAIDPSYTVPTYTPTKIIFDNGKIKSIEGRVKSLNQSLYEKSSELSEAYSKIDSLGIELEKKEVELSKKEKVLVKQVTRKVLPWWIFALCIIIGWIGRGYWPRVKKYFIPIKL